jgi:Peptidase family M23
MLSWAALRSELRPLISRAAPRVVKSCRVGEAPQAGRIVMRHAPLRCLLAFALSVAIFAAGAAAATAGRHKDISPPIRLHAPWANGVTFKMITYFGHGGHTNANDDYYATDWVVAGTDKGSQCEDAKNIGQPILAPAAGTVFDIQRSNQIGSGGNTVFMSFDDAPIYSAHFEHLASISVNEGEDIPAGTVIGTLGHTGLDASECAHVHFGVRKSINGQDLSIKPGPLDGQRVVPGATITSHNDGSPAPPKSRKGNSHSDQPHGHKPHKHHGGKH